MCYQFSGNVMFSMHRTVDDILVSAATEGEHLQKLEVVFERLEKAGLRACSSKCEFMVPSVSYLGHHIDQDGLHPLPDKVRAVVEAPQPRSVQELRAYLGLLTTMASFFLMFPQCSHHCTSC